MLPGFSAEMIPKDQGKESQAKIKRYMTMMDSMTNEGICFIPECFLLQCKCYVAYSYLNVFYHNPNVILTPTYGILSFVCGTSLGHNSLVKIWQIHKIYTKHYGWP